MKITGARPELAPDSGGRPSGLDALVRGVRIDSRQVGEGELFAPLKGEQQDGHEFIGRLDPRAAGSLVAADSLESVRSRLRGSSWPLLVVDDVLEALRALARHQRDSLRARVVGITGSVGKTTVKDFLGHLLTAAAPTTRARKSFNNHLGVPLTLLEADRQTRYLVSEIGTSGPGEIGSLAELVRPDLAVVTAVAPAHLAGLGNLDGVVREKSSLFEHLAQGGLAFLPAPIYGESAFHRALTKSSGQLIRYGWARNDLLRDGYWITGFRALSPSEGQGSRFQFEVNGCQRFETPLAGRHNITNALAAIAVARELGLDWQTIRQGVATLRLPPLRLELSSVGGIQLLDDTYNSNPASFRGALQATRDLRLAPGGRWHLVLGDFLELGEASRSFHLQVGDDLARSRQFSSLFTVGSEAHHAAREARRGGLNAYSFPDSGSPELTRMLASTVKPGDGILFKASRGIRLERAVQALRQQLDSGNRLQQVLNSRFSRHALLRS